MNLSNMKETYTKELYCTNCTYGNKERMYELCRAGIKIVSRGIVTEIPKGKTEKDLECPNCGCKTLEN